MYGVPVGIYNWSNLFGIHLRSLIRIFNYNFMASILLLKKCQNWVYDPDEVVFELGLYCFKTSFLTGVLLVFKRGEVLFKTGLHWRGYGTYVYEICSFTCWSHNNQLIFESLKVQLKLILHNYKNTLTIFLFIDHIGCT